MKRAFVLALTVVMLLAWGCALAEGAANAREGAQAPDFELTLLDGGTFRLSENRGKVVYLNIWATWCPPCVQEMPEIQKLAEAHPDELVVVGASVDQNEQTVRDFIRENGYSYSFAMDEGFKLAGGLYPTQYIPESVFIDPNGVVTHIEVGAADYEQFETWFEEALNNAK